MLTLDTINSLFELLAGSLSWCIAAPLSAIKPYLAFASPALCISQAGVAGTCFITRFWDSPLFFMGRLSCY
ncbi:MAG: hypothetical protein HOO93_05075 [Methyloglobulus sp.]|nr:hypothetical protein [Methyloglobulus sp.]